MTSIVKRYPATTLAAIVLLIGGGIAASLLLGSDSEAQSRFGQVLGLITIAVTTLLSVQRTESGNETTEQVATTLNAAVADNEQTQPAALRALKVLVEATERAERAATTMERVSNGHAEGSLLTREEDGPT